MKIHLVAIDLDGTLLTSGNEITAPTEAIVKAVRREQGVHVVLATARPPRSVKRFYDVLGLDGPMINYNGALVFDPAARRILMHAPISAATARGIVDLARDEHPEVLVSAEVLDRWYTDRVDAAYITQTGRLFEPDRVAPIDEWLAEPVTKLLLLGDGGRMNELGRSIARAFRYQVSVIQTEAECLQITHPTVSKARALKTVAGELGVMREQVMAIGDNANDVEMLQWAGVGVAMANAPESVLRAADYVTDHNDADGVAKAMHQLIMGGVGGLQRARA